MRLRLIHKLSLTLLVFAGAAILAMGGLTALQLRNGFSDYLTERDVQHFERFVRVLEARVARAGGPSDLLAGRIELRELLDELAPGPDFLVGQPALPPGPPPPGHTADAFPDRLQVLAPDGAVLLGQAHLERSDEKVPVERPVRANGRVVALARMRPAPIMRGGADARFLRDQYTLLAGGGLGLILLALATALWLARRWTQPLAAVREATQRLAQGELSVRVADHPRLVKRSDEFGDVVRNVNRMAEGLQQLEGTRRRWLADISHEVLTPLTVLRGDIEALHEGVRSLRPEAVVALREEVLRLSKLIDDLHLLAISDLQSLPCSMAEDDAMAMMSRLWRRYQGRATAAGLDLQLEVPLNALALHVLWDAGRIEQLLVNLLENSLRYTQAPGQVQMRLEFTDTQVSLVIEDSAPGCPASQLNQLFEPLYRGGTSRDGHSSGSGLGLAICQVIAKAHGGALSVEGSAVGGLRLRLLLPQPPGLPRVVGGAS